MEILHTDGENFPLLWLDKQQHQRFGEDDHAGGGEQAEQGERPVERNIPWGW